MSWSVRAFNVLATSGVNPLDDKDVMRAALLRVSGKRGCWRFLLDHRNCGTSTAEEILDALGIARTGDGHVCACKQCGKAMG